MESKGPGPLALEWALDIFKRLHNSPFDLARKDDGLDNSCHLNKTNVLYKSKNLFREKLFQYKKQ